MTVVIYLILLFALDLITQVNQIIFGDTRTIFLLFSGSLVITARIKIIIYNINLIKQSRYTNSLKYLMIIICYCLIDLILNSMSDISIVSCISRPLFAIMLLLLLFSLSDLRKNQRPIYKRLMLYHIVIFTIIASVSVLIYGYMTYLGEIPTDFTSIPKYFGQKVLSKGYEGQFQGFYYSPYNIILITYPYNQEVAGIGTYGRLCGISFEPSISSVPTAINLLFVLMLYHKKVIGLLFLCILLPINVVYILLTSSMTTTVSLLIMFLIFQLKGDKMKFKVVSATFVIPILIIISLNQNVIDFFMVKVLSGELDTFESTSLNVSLNNLTSSIIAFNIIGDNTITGGANNLGIIRLTFILLLTMLSLYCVLKNRAGNIHLYSYLMYILFALWNFKYSTFYLKFNLYIIFCVYIAYIITLKSPNQIKTKSINKCKNT